MKKIISLFSIASAALPLVMFAQVTGGPTATVAGLYGVVERVINWIAAIFFLLSTVYILMAAYKYLMAKGDAEEVKEAQNMLIYAVVGIVVAGLAYALPKIVVSFLGVTTVSNPT
ncbi:MAG: hypothetical protein WCV80_02440 [Candidatus Paceibacterota bacterium]|jgi:hypothetical protein